MKFANLILFTSWFVTGIAWFFTLGKVRSTLLPGTQGSAVTTLTVLMAAAMAYAGDILIRKAAPVSTLRKRLRLCNQRLRREAATVKAGQGYVMNRQEQGFAWVNGLVQREAELAIKRDHALPLRQDAEEL